jgi:adenosylhomocysteine nucleosidase
LNGLGIVAALVAESRPLGRASRRGAEPATLADGTLLSVSGVGPAAAAEGARRLLAAGARALLSWGLAGGLDPALAAGTLVLPREVISPEGRVFLTTADWRQRVSDAIAARHRICCGRLLTCREPLGSTAAKALAFRQTAAVAVDMESSAVAEVAAAEQLPFLVVRAIVDTARDAVPRVALQATSAGEGSLRFGQLLASLARTPAELPPLIRLARRYRTASRALSAVAGSGALAREVLREVVGGALP